MKLVIEDPKTAAKFEILFSNLVTLTEFVKICISDSGLHIQGMDQSKICLFDIVLKCEWFTIFETDEDDPSVFTVPSKIFYKVLSTYKPDQCLEIEINNNDELYLLDSDIVLQHLRYKGTMQVGKKPPECVFIEY